MLRLVALVVLGTVSSAGVVTASPAANFASLRRLRFSPNGQYLLAQDDSKITVLTVQPFSALFRIPADSASLAEFTPDSRQIIFIRSVGHETRSALSTPTAHQVERWSISNHERTVSTPINGHPCPTEMLSPDGGVLVCVDSKGTLSFVEMSSGNTLFVDRDFGQMSTGYATSQSYDPSIYGDRTGRSGPDTTSFTTRLNPSSALIQFSPDGRFLAAFPSDLCYPIVWDLLQKKKVSLGGRLRVLRYVYFVFLTPDRVVTSDTIVMTGQTTTTATLWTFPQGRALSKFKVPLGRLFPAADEDFVVVRPYTHPFPIAPPYAALAPEGDFNGSPAGAVDVRPGQAIVGESPLLDVFGSYYVMAQPAGNVGLNERSKGLVSTVVLAAD